MDLQFIYVIALAVLALLGGLLAARLLRQSRTTEEASKETAEHSRQVQNDLTTLRVAKLEVERRLAVEEQKSARIPELEKALTAAAGRIDQSRQAKIAVDSELAVARESITRLEAAATEAKGHQATAERSRDDLAAQADVLREHMNEMERTIAGRSEAATQQEQAAGDLRQRLSAAETARDQALARIDSAVQAKAGAEATLARAASQIQEKTQRIESLENEARQVRGDIETRFESLALAKATLEANMTAAASQAQEKSERAAALEEELRQARSDIETRFESLTQAKATLEANLGAATSQMQERSQRVAALEDELRQLHNQSQSRLEMLGAARTALEANLAAAAAQVQEKSQHLESLAEELRHARAEADARRAEAEAARAEAGRHQSGLALMQENLEQERRHGAEKLALIADARDQMTQEFRNLAEEVIRRHGEEASRQNKAEIDVVLTPLRERLSEFQQGLASAHDENMRQRADLAEQIRALSDNSVQMAGEAQALAAALRGRSEGLGAWGEMLLSSILERSGLSEGEDYVFRESYSADGGERLRPDVAISLPGDQRVLIDSKIPLAAYEAFVNAGPQDPANNAALGDHCAAMAAHIRSLADRGPPPVAESRRDYTVMFVPVEGALAAALRHDPDLMGLAVENNIAIATPGTLMMALRSVANVWQAERRSRRAEKIAERAGKLYDSFASYLGDVEMLGDHLVRARHAYEESLARLASGRDSLIGQVEELKDMGAKATKPLRRISAAERRFEDTDEEETGPGMEEADSNVGEGA
jgi:DNA recombination protein RmuC